MIVEFKGTEYLCPEYTKFIAVDEDGTVFAYEEEPFVGDISVEHDPSECWDSCGEQCEVYPAKVFAWFDEIYTVS